MRLAARLLFLASLAYSTGHAQQPPALPPDVQTPKVQPRTEAGQQAITTIRARAKLVVVDVVVTGRDRKPFQGLQQSDFSLTEGGVPQTIKSFEEHKSLSAAEAAKLVPPPTMPPGIFTNYQAAPVNSAVNILLLDALNTPLKDQAFVRAQLLEYVKNAKPGNSIAIFGLSTKLSMLQGFTTNPDILRTAIKRSSGQTSSLLDDAVGTGTQTIAEQAADLGLANAGLNDLESIQQSFQLQLRAQYTLDAMSVLARYLANIPGRKNLIWFSGSFPIDILPDVSSPDPFLAVASSEKEYRETINQLARSQVAVYPIDARGLMTLPMFQASNSGSRYARSSTAMGDDLNAFAGSQASELGTMRSMAHDTGGEAFVNTNGLSQAVAKAIDAGSNYYTLSYTPTKAKYNNEYRKIEVKLSHSGYNLAFRRGYYADDPNSPSATTSAAQSVTATNRATAKPDANSMLQAMVHGLPGSTEIIYKVRIVPATLTPEDNPAKGNLLGAKGFVAVKGPFRRYLIDYAAAPDDITFALGTDQLYHCGLEFVTLAYQSDGQLAVATTNEVEAALTLDQVTAMRRGGLKYHQEISVPAKGDYFIRTGIHDVTGNKIGSVELPVASVNKLPPPSQ